MWGSRQSHSASERSVGYVVLMHARVAVPTPDYPFLDSFSTHSAEYAPERRHWMALVGAYYGGPSICLGPVEALVPFRDQPLGIVTRLPSVYAPAEGEKRFFAVGQHHRGLA